MPCQSGILGDLAVICCKDLSDLIRGLTGSIRGSSYFPNDHGISSVIIALNYY